MPTWDFDLIVDGDAASAGSVNTPFGDAQSAINDLTQTSTKVGCFNFRQAGTIATNPPGPLAIEGDDSGTHTYTFANFGTDIVYASYGNDTGSEAAPVVGGGTDRVIVGHTSAGGAYSGPTAKLTWTGVKIGMANGDNVAALLVMFNVEIRAADFGQADALDAVFSIQYQLNGTTWYTIDESERFVSLDDRVLDLGTADETDVDFDVPIRTLITKEVVDENGNPAVDMVTGVRAMLSLYASGGTYTGTGIELERWNLTVLPMHALEP